MRLRPQTAVLATTLLLGLVLRIWGMFPPRSALWFDEAMWAERLLSLPLLELGIRPIGFMWVTRQLTQVLGVTEVSLRLLSTVASVALLALTPVLARQLRLTTLGTLAVTALVAVHPALIDYGNEFKPYAFETFLHAGLLHLWLRAREERNTAAHAALLVLLPVGFLFAYNLAFFYPGVYLLLGWAALRKRMWLGVGTTVTSAAVAAAACGLIYSAALKKVHHEKTDDYWGSKYNVFFVPTEARHQVSSRIDWTTTRLLDIVAFPGSVREPPHWTPAARPGVAAEWLTVSRGGWIAVAIAGGVVLWQKRALALAAALFGTPLVLALLNVAGQWPLGAFRTNLFLLATAIPLAAIGLDALLMAGKWPRALTAGLLCITLLPNVAVGLSLHGRKDFWTRHHAEPVILERLHALRQAESNSGADLLLLDSHTWHSHQFYLTRVEETRAAHANYFSKAFRAERVHGEPKKAIARAQKELAASKPVWLVVSKDIDDAKSRAGKAFPDAHVELIEGEHLVIHVRPKETPE